MRSKLLAISRSIISPAIGSLGFCLTFAVFDYLTISRRLHDPWIADTVPTFGLWIYMAWFSRRHVPFELGIFDSLAFGSFLTLVLLLFLSMPCVSIHFWLGGSL